MARWRQAHSITGYFIMAGLFAAQLSYWDHALRDRLRE